MQWETDLIGYKTLTSYGSPSYDAQVMLSNHIGAEVVESKLDKADPRVFNSATRDPQKKIL
jgi:alpha-N-arabinofuranosidase